MSIEQNLSCIQACYFLYKTCDVQTFEKVFLMLYSSGSIDAKARIRYLESMYVKFLSKHSNLI